MIIGKLRHRIDIQTATLAQNSTGEATTTWSTVATVWGRIEPMGGSESQLGPEVVADATHKITIRATTSVSPTKRLQFGSRAFDINAVLTQDEINHVQVLMCKEAT